ncbi:MAG: hypothetical protein JWS12_567 [Candidatus Saccharibacteria bacterium]|nr:hypothetical protein [Candidatus Saccharibacteria bacterium]
MPINVTDIVTAAADVEKDEDKAAQKRIAAIINRMVRVYNSGGNTTVFDSVELLLGIKPGGVKELLTQLGITLPNEDEPDNTPRALNAPGASRRNIHNWVDVYENREGTVKSTDVDKVLAGDMVKINEYNLAPIFANDDPSQIVGYYKRPVPAPAPAPTNDTVVVAGKRGKPDTVINRVDYQANSAAYRVLEHHPDGTPKRVAKLPRVL